MKRAISGFVTLLAALAFAAPQATVSAMTENGDELVVDYTLDADAIVVVDIQTNVADDVYASIGGEHQWTLDGDVNKRIEAGARSFTWTPSSDMPDCDVQAAKLKVGFSTYADGDAPDYMVVDTAPTSTVYSVQRVKYYPNVESLPGGLLSNGAYFSSKIVMRHIRAKGVEWVMGTVGEIGRSTSNENAHTVTLTNDYWMAVFETTYAQSSRVGGGTYGKIKPHRNVTWNGIRGAAASYSWPLKPSSDSVLGLLYTRTGIRFDLPSEAQWEFACRAGNGEGFWNDGSPIISTTVSKETNLPRLARFGYSWSSADSVAGQIPGLHAPNSWGLYDMHGNESEHCLDWYQADITGLGGRVNSWGAYCADGVTAGGNKVNRGGTFTTGVGGCRPSARAGSYTPAQFKHEMGYRLCTVYGFQDDGLVDSLE